MAEQLRRERLRREMIDEIIGTARLLLEKDSPSAISVRAIARQVGVTAPAIYRYYPSLDALMSALREATSASTAARRIRPTRIVDIGYLGHLAESAETR